MTFFGIFFIACRTPRSPKTSSAPARIASKPDVRWNYRPDSQESYGNKSRLTSLKLTFSTNLPIPETVSARPPNIWVASSAISRPFLEIYLELEKFGVSHLERTEMPYCLSRPIGPARLLDI